MAVKFAIVILAILIVTCKFSESKVIPEEDETVNINIKNGAGLKISYPSGEIIVPSERKNVRIKTIDVFEEKNSPPHVPDQKQSEHVQKYPHPPNYREHNYYNQEHGRPWQNQRQIKEKPRNHIEDTYDYYDDFFSDDSNDFSAPVEFPAMPVQVMSNYHVSAILDIVQEMVWAGRAFLHGDVATIRSMVFYLIQKYLFGDLSYMYSKI